MPSKSDKQHRTMEAAAHNPGFAMKVGIPAGVAKEFVRADQRTQAAHIKRHFGGRGRGNGN